jgi:hypothetical protein
MNEKGVRTGLLHLHKDLIVEDWGQVITSECVPQIPRRHQRTLGDRPLLEGGLLDRLENERRVVGHGRCERKRIDITVVL